MASLENTSSRIPSPPAICCRVTAGRLNTTEITAHARPIVRILTELCFISLPSSVRSHREGSEALNSQGPRPHERRLSKDAAPGPCQHVRMMLQVTPPAADVKLGSRSTTSVSQRYLRRPSSIAPAPRGARWEATAESQTQSSLSSLRLSALKSFPLAANADYTPPLGAKPSIFIVSFLWRSLICSFVRAEC